MKTAGIAIDDWKLAIFERHLTQNGYTFSKGDGLTVGTLLLRVTTENLDALGVVCRAAEAEAQRSKGGA